MPRARDVADCTPSQTNGLLRQSHLLTGYVPGADSLLVVSRTVDRLRSINPNLIYVLDPVMGDDGRIYVSESVIPIYKSLMTKGERLLLVVEEFSPGTVVGGAGWKHGS